MHTKRGQRRSALATGEPLSPPAELLTFAGQGWWRQPGSGVQGQECLIYQEGRGFCA